MSDGDPACWIEQVCAHCGGMVDSAPHVCRTPVDVTGPGAGAADISGPPPAD